MATWIRNMLATATRLFQRKRTLAGIAGLVSLALIFAITATILTRTGTVRATPVNGAGFTTFDATQGGCLDSPNGINCNNYASKDDVYMGGGPTGGSGLSSGSYYFAVLAPGYQHGGFVDGADGNLSDTTASNGGPGGGDAVSNRTFTVSAGVITSYGGSHATGTSPNGKFIIALSPYDDTPNAGGVYILAICQSGATTPAQCKFDAFRINPATPPPPQPLVVTKDANPSFDRTYSWGISKAVDKTTANLYSASDTATFNYTVSVTHDAGTDSNWQVTGTISVTNPNADDVTGVDVTDAINDANATCDVQGGSGATVSGGQTATFPYTCAYSAAPASASETNTATATWPDQTLSNGLLSGDSALFDVSFAFSTPNIIDGSVNVTDSLGGALGTVSYTDPSPTTFTYSHAFPAPTTPPLCVSDPNTASFTAITTGTTGSVSKSVQVCRVPFPTGALTMGFWQNKNGQGIISGANQAALGTWLRQFHAFSNAPSSGVATYAYNIIKAATCGGTTCNAMLRAQMLATALDVYFSDATLGGNKIHAPQALGGVHIDLTLICQMIDGSGGTATCGSTYENVSGAFGGATSLNVSQMLTYQNTADPLADAGAAWYSQVKASQVLAKDAFDAINNQVAFEA